MTSRANRQDERSDLSVPSCTPEGFLAWCAASLLKTPSWARTPSRNDSGCRGHRSVSTQAMQGSPPGTFGQEPPDPQTAPRGAVRCSDRCCADPLLKLEERSGISLGRGRGGTGHRQRLRTMAGQCGKASAWVFRCSGLDMSLKEQITV